jgi:RecA/RadA recombinase
VPIAPRLVAELNANLPGAVRRGDAPLAHGHRERLATGFPALDSVLDGGLPRGQLTELVGVASTGLTSVVHRLLGHVTKQGQVAAWIDAPDAFDPASAVAAGVDLERLLWVRPPDLATAFTAAEAVLALGGFPLVLLDASAPPYRPRSVAGNLPAVAPNVARRAARHARRTYAMGDALHVWMRLARASARSRSALVVLQRTSRRPPARMNGARGADEGSGSASFSAAVRLEIEPLRVMWNRAGGAPTLLDGLVARIVVTRNRGGRGNPGPVVLEIA